MFDLGLIFVGIILVASGAGKLTSPSSVRSFVEGLGLSRRPALAAGLIVGAAESALGLLLIFGLMLRLATASTAILAAGFLGAHAVARLRGNTAACRCFGSLDVELRPAVSSARSAVLFVAAVLLAIAAWNHGTHPGIPVGRVVPVLSGVLGAMTYVVVFHLVNEVILLRRRDREIQEGLAQLRSDLAASAR
jgi:uncharacterized membrane protein YphA (DoxX/SURF4 family)